MSNDNSRRNQRNPMHHSNMPWSPQVLASQYDYGGWAAPPMSEVRTPYYAAGRNPVGGGYGQQGGNGGGGGGNGPGGGQGGPGGGMNRPDGKPIHSGPMAPGGAPNGPQNNITPEALRVLGVDQLYGPGGLENGAMMAGPNGALPQGYAWGRDLQIVPPGQGGQPVDPRQGGGMGGGRPQSGFGHDPNQGILSGAMRGRR